MAGRDDWYRSSSWSEKDRESFEAKFARTRKSSRSQYLSIQAWCLFNAGLIYESLALINRKLSDYPDSFNLSSAYLLRAMCYAALDKTDLAIENFRLSIQTEREFPNVRTTVSLDFAQFVVENDLIDLFDEALSVLRDLNDLRNGYPLHQYMHYGLEACLLDGLGLDGAIESVELARQAAAKRSSGFRNHPKLLLVEEEPDWLRWKLEKIQAR